VLQWSDLHGGEVDDSYRVDVIAIYSDALIIKDGVEEVVRYTQARLFEELSFQCLLRRLAPVDTATREPPDFTTVVGIRSSDQEHGTVVNADAIDAR
jgi:hypothetical protein